MADRIRLSGLTVDAFQADTDRIALEALKRVPLLPLIVQKFYEVGLDRWLYCANMSMAVRCGPKQFPSLYNMLRESCDILDMPEPELYVSSNPFPNAFAGGVERPYIVLRSSILDTLDDDQLIHLLGHELGHIKANHVLYMTVAHMLFPLLEMIGRRTLGLGDVATIGLVLAMYEWYRQAEITADRAGLLTCQSLDVSVGANLMLTAGPNRFRNELSQEAYMEQAQSYQESDNLGKFLFFFLNSSMYTHPMPVHRTQALHRWVLSGEFDRIIAGDFTRPTKMKSA